ncbi:DUF1642 domain-containing protein [Lactococcus lactis]|uniref:DUF1642 domain-containing protein n=1 Tax=Lactococcus lactis TaxID=1358 RepID=UPI00072BB5EF|nr:DUF1642 domain-containing protein [Lactococcus lactis]KST98523.1 Phage protein [Lactococcus lactis subsp. lactis]
MTKFEEEAIKEAMKSGMAMICYERGCGAPNIGLNLKLGRGVHNFPWLEFAKNWHPDEEFQELLSKYDALNDNYEKEVIKSSKLETSNLKMVSEGSGLLSDNATLTKEVANLKSQLQQQALPVVHECVAGAIESIPDHYSAFGAIDLIIGKIETLPEENKDWLPVYNWIYECIENQDAFALAFITRKYEVEKPQLFKVVFPNSTSVLQKNGELNSFADTVYKRYLLDNAMTEQEIKSIDERYWQFAVPVEDGE